MASLIVGVLWSLVSAPVKWTGYRCCYSLAHPVMFQTHLSPSAHSLMAFGGHSSDEITRMRPLWWHLWLWKRRKEDPSWATCSFLHVTPPWYWSTMRLSPDAQQESQHAFGSLSLKNLTVIVWGSTCQLLVLILGQMESSSASSLLRLQFSGDCLFSSGTFRASAFTFNGLSTIWSLFLCKMVNMGLFHYLHVDINFSQHYLLKMMFVLQSMVLPSSPNIRWV